MVNADSVVEHQPVGTLMVDAETVVRFANPAAAQLLGISSERLVGETFGLPLVSEAVTDVNVATDEGAVRTLAMRITDLPGPDALRLVTLFDVSRRARRYENEHRLVEALQRSVLLEHMPALPGIALAARYLPGDTVAQVGGDWYDAIPLQDGRLGLAIGDVAGHGIGSVALMSQLRNALRAYALEHAEPAAVVDRLDRLLHHLEPRGMATLVYSVYDPAVGTLSFAVAGHPYPLVVAPDGTTTYLMGGRAVPLGTGIVHEQPQATAAIDPGSLLVLYTDGLVERRNRLIDEGLEALARSIEPAMQDPGATCETILARLIGEQPPGDDVALLVMRVS